MKHFLSRVSVTLLACLIGLLSVSARAQAASSVTATMAVSWTAPTTGGGGTEPLTGVNVIGGYNIYASTAPLTSTPANPTANVAGTGTSVSATVPATVGQTIYVYVAACNSSGCSGLSTAATYVVPVTGVAPDVPTNVTITVTIKP